MLDRTRCQTLLDAGRAVLRPLHDLSSPVCRRVGVDISCEERPHPTAISLRTHVYSGRGTAVQEPTRSPHIAHSSDFLAGAR